MRLSASCPAPRARHGAGWNKRAIRPKLPSTSPNTELSGRWGNCWLQNHLANTPAPEEEKNKVKRVHLVLMMILPRSMTSELRLTNPQRPSGLRHCRCPPSHHEGTRGTGRAWRQRTHHDVAACYIIARRPWPAPFPIIPLSARGPVVLVATPATSLAISGSRKRNSCGRLHRGCTAHFPACRQKRSLTQLIVT